MKTDVGDRRIQALVQLAQHELTGDAPRRDELAAISRLEERLLARRRPGWSRTLAAAGFAAVAVAASVALWLALRAPDLTYRVVNGSESAGTVTGGAGTRIQFSDGSEISLEPGAETKIEDLGANGARVDLRRGSLGVAIEKRPKAAWFVDAGPYTVEVTGTSFDVRWSARERRFEVALYSGSVVVTGLSARGGYRLRPGQRLVARPDAPLHVESDAARGVPAQPAEPHPTAGGPNAAARRLPEASGSADAAHGSALRSPEKTSWRQKVAEGSFDEVLRAAEGRGLAQTLASASLEDLSALADAARYARRTPVAERALAAQRERFPSSSAARDAAFFLGRLSEGARAIGWYDRYLSESPSGPYASQALGRKMMLLYETQGAAAARGVALDYAARYPKGPYVSAARKIERETTRR